MWKTKKGKTTQETIHERTDGLLVVFSGYDMMKRQPKDIMWGAELKAEDGSPVHLSYGGPRKNRPDRSSPKAVMAFWDKQLPIKKD